VGIMARSSHAYACRAKKSPTDGEVAFSSASLNEKQASGASHLVEWTSFDDVKHRGEGVMQPATVATM
jgi:hypothetical protein